MTEKELKRLSRAELLELLLIQTRETEHLRAKLEKANQQLADRELRVRESGSLAEAVLVINGVVEFAQAAADQYLENIARMEKETKLRCRQMLENAKAEAERIRTEARAQRTEDGEKSLDELLGEALELIGQ